MSPRLVLGIIIVLLAIAVIIGITIGTPDEEPVATEPDPETDVAAEVQYTGTSFEPAEVTIETGDTVRFINNSDRGMWVASDPHPSHTNLPGFDQGQEVLQGETYEFTFEEEGRWSYHDHLNPTHSGAVVVE